MLEELAYEVNSHVQVERTRFLFNLLLREILSISESLITSSLRILSDASFRAILLNRLNTTHAYPLIYV